MIVATTTGATPASMEIMTGITIMMAPSDTVTTTAAITTGVDTIQTIFARLAMPVTTMDSATALATAGTESDSVQRTAKTMNTRCAVTTLCFEISRAIATRTVTDISGAISVDMEKAIAGRAKAEPRGRLHCEIGRASCRER